MINILISGLGGVGGYYGGKLAQAYAASEDVAIYFIARGKHKDAIERDGLRIQSTWENFTVRPKGLSDRAEELGVKADYILCCTKDYDLEENIRSLLPAIDRNTIIVPLLNGANIWERIAAVVPKNEVWCGLTYIVAMKAGAGVIENALENPKMYFGSPAARHPREKELEGILQAAGINGESREDILYQVWKKYILISASASSTSYFDKPTRVVIETETETFRSLLREAIAVAQANGIDISEEMCQHVLDHFWKNDLTTTTSMHRDFMAGGKTELESLCGYLVREGDRLGVPVPTYRKIYEALLSKANRSKSGA
ncbi:ketopantoate reductase family protein [Tannerella sp.]|uniref:ketopantoate reductase family protein n=1 Tax=Tannerella sp. TaxID=2382127 RepID=UPI0026DACD20|nr:2-dehydropantoate 2-reductase [Tannerella sp.]MDO4704016.1 2-dehydropantoate 2-reductase [Tannerella sp.]